MGPTLIPAARLVGNMPLDTHALQNEIVPDELSGILSENLAKKISHALQSLSLRSWWQNLAHNIGSADTTVLIIFIFLILGSCFLWKD